MRGPEPGPEPTMEGDVLDTLEALGYKGPLLEEQALTKAAEGGLSSPEFSELCVWLGSQIKSLCNLEESITSAVFLSTELQASQILQNKKCKNSQLDKNSEIHQEVQAMCDTLGVPKSTTSDIPLMLNQVESKVKDILSKVRNNHVGKPLLKIDLNPEQAQQLERINDALSCEYECRRRMLMKRLDVTVQSFGWSDRAKVKTDDIARIYQPKRYALSPKTTITMAHLLAAREDLSKIIRTSSGASREKTACAINKVGVSFSTVENGLIISYLMFLQILIHILFVTW
uniref:Family with sequence similarity 98 member B n=1 Tax=Propithecus coquereli TaxID=379532 RepID=A0A2K6GL14_PROCO